MKYCVHFTILTKYYLKREVKWLTNRTRGLLSSPFNMIVNYHIQFSHIMFSYIVFPDAPPPTWEQLEKGLVAVKTVVHGLVDFIQNHSKKGADPQQVSLNQPELR